MIKKLYNLKKMQLDQELVAKQQLVNEIDNYDNQIKDLHYQLSTTGVKMFGSISDFKVLAIHKNSLKFEKDKLQRAKILLQQKVEIHNQKIVEFHKELEQYKYILEVERQKLLKEQIKNEELIASEYVQAKWVAQQ